MVVRKIIDKFIKKSSSGMGLNQIQPCRNSMGAVLDHLKLLGFQPGTIIDVGIAYGTEGLYGKFTDVQYLLIEPLAEYEQTCQELTNQYGGEYIIAAASDQPGELTMNVHPDLSGSSMFNESEGKHVDGEPRVVECVTLDQVCEQKGMRGPYLIKLDTQGAELLVMDGAEKVLEKTEVVIMEAFLFQFYKGIPLIHDIIAYMKQRGFVVYDVFGGINRLLDNALAQVDLVFVKEEGMFRTTNDFATREQREAFRKERVKEVV